MQGPAARHLVQVLREKRPEYRTYVTVQAAFLIDFKNDIKQRPPPTPSA